MLHACLSALLTYFNQTLKIARQDSLEGDFNY